MDVNFKITNGQLKVLSNICSDLVVVWLVAIFATSDIILLIRDVALAAVFWFIAVKAEENLQKNE